MLLETRSVEATVHHVLTSQGLCSDRTAYVSENWGAPKARNWGLAENVSSQVSGCALSTASATGHGSCALMGITERTKRPAFSAGSCLRAEEKRGVLPTFGSLASLRPSPNLPLPVLFTFLSLSRPALLPASLVARCPTCLGSVACSPSHASFSCQCVHFLCPKRQEGTDIC